MNKEPFRIYHPEDGGAYLAKITGGLYFEDVKKMLSENGIPPGRTRDFYLTHADADHAGLNGYFNM